MTEETTDQKSQPTDILTEFKPVPDDHPEPPHDLSWLIVAVDGGGDGWIMDSAPGFDACDLLPNANSCEENGVVVPSGLPVGIYRLDNVRVSGGDLVQCAGGDDYYTDIEIWSDKWLRLDGLAEAALAWYKTRETRYESDRDLTALNKAEDDLAAAIDADHHTIATGCKETGT